jgi:5'-nucleotidase (lipoprotein e(P4) family)
MTTKKLLLTAPCISITLLLALWSPLTAKMQTAAEADNEYQIGAVLWQQSRGEVSALQYQAYSLARLMYDRDIRVNRRLKRPRAVVVDVDETVLDNSRYQATAIVNHQEFDSKSWTDWCNRAEATAIPGAVEFLNYAAHHGARVFYVTNRSETEKAGTIRNLKQAGFPGVTDETVVVRENESSKEARRQHISQRYRIVLLCGDNLADFSSVFDGKTPEVRAAAVLQARQKFGTQFIVLPNPMYGDWEEALYGYSELSEQAKAAKRRAALKTYSAR